MWEILRLVTVSKLPAMQWLSDGGNMPIRSSAKWSDWVSAALIGTGSTCPWYGKLRGTEKHVFDIHIKTQKLSSTTGSFRETQIEGHPTKQAPCSPQKCLSVELRGVWRRNATHGLGLSKGATRMKALKLDRQICLSFDFPVSVTILQPCKRMSLSSANIDWNVWAPKGIVPAVDTGMAWKNCVSECAGARECMWGSVCVCVCVPRVKIWRLKTGKNCIRFMTFITKIISK